MKKLIALAAVATCGAAFAVESANIVGYAQSDLDDDGGSVIVTPQFMGIGTTGGVIDLQSIKCNEEAEDLVTLMTLDNLGYTVDTYYWSTDKGEFCWLDGDTMKKAVNVEFAPGQAFWVQSDDVGNVFQSAGQVNTSDIVVELDDDGGSVIAGNATPVTIDLQDIVCEEEAEDLVTLMTLDNLGYTIDTYYWSTDKGEYCWLDGDTMKKAVNVEFAPGQAFWIQSDDAGFTITFPGVELN